MCAVVAALQPHTGETAKCNRFRSHCGGISIQAHGIKRDNLVPPRLRLLALEVGIQFLLNELIWRPLAMKPARETVTCGHSHRFGRLLFEVFAGADAAERVIRRMRAAVAPNHPDCSNASNTAC